MMKSGASNIRGKPNQKKIKKGKSKKIEKKKFKKIEKKSEKGKSKN